MLPGFSQPVDDGSNLLAALNSSFPSVDLSDNISQLSVYRGKELITPTTVASSSSSRPTEIVEKAFAWL